MTYIPSNAGSGAGAKVIYRSKGGKTSKIFSALDWLAQLVTHIPNRYEQMARYYGYYSNKSRGMRKKAGTDDQTLKLNSPTITPTRNCCPSILGPNNDC